MHRSSASMISLSSTRHVEATDANDAGDDSDLFAFGLETWPLLNMPLEIRNISIRVQRKARTTCIACLMQAVTQAFALLVFCCINISLRQLSTERQATSQCPIGSFFISKGNDVDPEIFLRSGLNTCPGD